MVFCMAWQEVCRGARSRSSDQERRHTGAEPLHPLKQVTHENRNFLSHKCVTNSARATLTNVKCASHFFLGPVPRFFLFWFEFLHLLHTLLHCQNFFALLVQVFQVVRAQILEEILGDREQVEDHPLLQEISRLQTRCEDLTQLQKVH